MIPTLRLKKISLRLLTAGLFLAAIAGLIVAREPQTAHAATAYQFPCSPNVVSGYDFGTWVSGSRGYHAGQDFGCRQGTPVYAVADGQVVYSAKTPDSWRWGNLIMIQHVNQDGSQATSIYGHLNGDRRVGAGQVVGKGQLIGFIGAAWSSENGNWGDHLHLSFHYGPYGAAVGTYAPEIHGYEPASLLNTYMNPAAYIKARSNYYDYQFINQIGVAPHGSGEEYWIELQVRNTGTVTWRAGGANPVRLAGIHPVGRGSGFSINMGGQGWVDPNLIAMVADTPPGGIATFRAKFNNRFVAPGTYDEHFTLLVQGVGYMADKGVFFRLTVTRPAYLGQWFSQETLNDFSPTVRANVANPWFMVPGQRMNLKAYIRNVGDAAWQNGGSIPVRLITARPLGFDSGFATIGAPGIHPSENWLNLNRPSAIDGVYNPANGVITPTGTVQPGQIAVFSFTVTAPSYPGLYAHYFNTVAENASFMNDLAMWFPLRVLPPGYHYEFAGQQVPPATAAGNNQVSGTVDIRNVGQTSWLVGGNVKLGTDRPFGRASNFRGSDWLSLNQVTPIDLNLSAPGKPVVGPGEVARFQFTFGMAQATDGIHAEYLRPFVDGLGPMPEDYGIFLPVTVQSPERQYEVIRQNFSKDLATLRWDDELTTTLVVRNTGRRPWATSGPNAVALGTDRPTDRGSGFNVLTGSDPWLAVNRPSGIDGKVVNLDTLETAPATEIRQGELALLRFPMRVPRVNPGPYPEHFNLVEGTNTWLPARGLFFPMNVIPPVYNYSYQGQTVNGAVSNQINLREGQQATLSIDLKNEGNIPWQSTGPNAVRLITDRPLGRSSQVHWNWLTVTRPAAFGEKVIVNPDGSRTTSPASVIAPGEIGRFTFQVNGWPGVTGSRHEYFRLVAENVAFMRDLGIFWAVDITR